MEKSKSQQEKDLSIRADMAERVDNARKEVLAIHTAMGRWSRNADVANMLRTLLLACERMGTVGTGILALPAEYIARPDRMRPMKGWRVDLVGKHAAMFAEAHDCCDALQGDGTDERPFRMTGFTVVSVLGGTSANAPTVKLLLTHDATGMTWGPVAVANVALPCAVTPQEATAGDVPADDSAACDCAASSEKAHTVGEHAAAVALSADPHAMALFSAAE